MRSRSVAVAASIAVVAVPISAPDSRAATDEAYTDVFNGRIAFTSFRVDHDPGPGEFFSGDIFTMTPEGADLRQLTDDPGYDAQSDWSPDGTTIAYRIRKPGERANYEIARMPAEGASRTILTTTPAGSTSSQPSWYPDGSAILFRRSGRGVDADVWTMGPMGEVPRLLLALAGHQWYPSLSPDMRKLVLATTLSASGDTDRGIFTINADGTGLALLYDAPGLMDSAPSWAPDGETIAFESNSDPLGENPEGDREIFLIDADGERLEQLTHNSDHDEGPAFSPDGEMIVYTGGPDDQQGDIRVMTVDGELVRQLTDFPGRDESPDWQRIPAPETTRSCGDRPRFGLREIRTRRLPCAVGRSLIRRWLHDRLFPRRRFDVEVADFGGTERVVITRRSWSGRQALVTFLSEPSATEGDAQ